MSDIHIRRQGRAGRITLTRPEALNALTYRMCLDIEAALDAWRDDDSVALVIIDAAGERAFCAGGDIQEMYDTARAGDYAYGRRFWADEYRLNAKIAEYPKPYVALMQGFTMGGGVGVSCHGAHRIVCDSSQIAMPECAIGLVPDVGGSLLLARAPGRLGDYLGTTGTRMGPGDAIFAGFADSYVDIAHWPALVESLCDTGGIDAIARAATPAPASPLAEIRDEIDRLFAAPAARDIIAAIEATGSETGQKAGQAIRRNSPLSVACTISLVRQARTACDIRAALAQEYRFTWRAADQGDFIEGIRAAIIDKDRAPRWQHASLEDVTNAEVEAMLAPLGANELQLEGTP